MKKGDWQGLGLVLGVFIVFFGLIFLIPRQGKVPVFNYREMATAEVAILEQEAQALKVKVTMESAGFVSLHRAMGDAPGEILRQIRVSEGLNQDISISTEGLEGPVIILLFADDGDGVFESGVDLPVVRNGVSVRAEGILKS